MAPTLIYLASARKKWLTGENRFSGTVTLPTPPPHLHRDGLFGGIRDLVDLKAPIFAWV